MTLVPPLSDLFDLSDLFERSRSGSQAERATPAGRRAAYAAVVDLGTLRRQIDPELERSRRDHPAGAARPSGNLSETDQGPDPAA